MRKLICILVTCLLYSQYSHAATPDELGFQQNEQLLREQQRELKMLERERLLRELERSLRVIEIPQPEPRQAITSAPEVCFIINEIVLDGANNLLGHEKRSLTEPWLGWCMSPNDIDELRSNIDRYYINNGWIMSRTYLLPQQNIRQGKLIFKVLEGTLDEIRLNFNELEARAAIATAFPGMLGEVIQLRDIEQGIDQINRLASSNATMTIEPVKDKPGYSRMLVSNIINNPYRMTLGFDNQGSESTGKRRGKISLDTDNLLAINDNLYLNATDTAGSKSSDKSSSSAGLNLSIPYGYWSYGLGINRSEYVSTNTGDTGSFKVSGNSNTESFNISRLVHRDQNSKTTASIVINRKDTSTFVEDVKLETGSRRLAVADVKLFYVERSAQDIRSAQIAYSRGLDAFGALLDDPLTSDDIPKAQFEKLSWDVSYSKPFVVDNHAFNYSMTLSGQASRDALFGSEQIAIGDLSSVRGFRDSPASGDSGSYIKNDVSWSPFEPPALLRGIRLTAGLDLGYVRVRNNNINTTGDSSATLAGWALGAQQLVSYEHDQQLSW
ncbi:MAG: ShlB/FhaC/HecB family hemolysin secretion/activation protein, partial [Gammaproteobacteria bacterium]